MEIKERENRKRETDKGRKEERRGETVRERAKLHHCRGTPGLSHLLLMASPLLFFLFLLRHSLLMETPLSEAKLKPSLPQYVLQFGVGFFFFFGLSGSCLHDLNEQFQSQFIQRAQSILSVSYIPQ